MRNPLRFLIPLLAFTAPVVGSPMPPDGHPDARAGSRVESRTGQQIYADMCARCHGPNGEGVDNRYDEPLTGDLSIESLARLIDRTMPEDNEEALDAEGSAKVAEYIYHTFYSPEAHARNHPPRIDLVHLTNRQFRESVADLIGSFLSPVPPGEGTGLRAEYYESEGMNKKAAKKLEREDAVLSFDFGEGPPVEGCSAEQFSIAWNGSLLVRDTGFYEFRLTTPNGARLYLNRDLRPGDRNSRDDSAAKRQPALIDEWVSSGDEPRQSSARVFLLGGRSYPIRLDYFKFKEKRGSVSLEWKRPHGVWEVLQAPHISPAPATRVAVASTTFPPDDASQGYERGSAVSKGWLEAIAKAAIEISGEVVDRLGILAGSSEDSPNRAEELRAFGHKLAGRAFRRPLTDEERQRYVDSQFGEGLPPEVSLKRVVMLVVKSPRFLYPEAGAPRDQWTVASRLALVLWDSLPDQPLLDAAARGELSSPDQVREQAVRMIADPRAKAKLREFFHRWLAFDRAHEINKDNAVFPGFDEQIVADLRDSLDAFVERVIWSESSDLRELLVADYLLLNDRLARFYGAEPPAGPGFQPVKFDPARRAGVFTHPYLLAALSYPRTTSPIHRGVFLTRNVLGRTLRPPPEAVAFIESEFDPTLTMREKVTELTRAGNCMTCHGTINSLGFALENYDAVGRWRTTDNNKPVNPVAEYVTTEGEVVPLQGPRDVANHAVTSAAARRGFINQLFQQTVKQPVRAFGRDALDRLDEEFARSGWNVRNLVVETAVMAALHGM